MSSKKLPIQQDNFASGDSRVIGISSFTSSEASLFLAAGTALLEALNRLKLQPAVAAPVWSALAQQRAAAEQVAKARGCEAEFLVCTQLLEVVKEADRASAQQWLKDYLEEDQFGACAGLDLGMRCYLSSIVNKPSITQETFSSTVNRSAVVLLKNMAEGLKLNVLLTSSTTSSCIQNSCGDNLPLLCLHEGPQRKYSVAYFQEHLLVDQTGQMPTGGLLAFPFVYQAAASLVRAPSMLPMAPPPKAATDPVVLDLVNAMCQYIVTGGLHIEELERSIDLAKDTIPGLYTETLEDLRRRL